MRPLFRLLTLGMLLVFTLSAWAATPITVATEQEGIQLRTATDSGLSLSCGLPAVESFDVQTTAGSFSQLQIAGFGRSQRLGEPSLPISRQIIAVPLNAKVRADVLDSKRSEVNLADYGIRFPILPAQPSVAKNQNVADIPFAYNPAAYALRGYGDRPLVRVEELGILRGLRLCVVEIAPVRYDPSTQTLELYTDIEIAVAFDGGDLAATRDLRARTWSPAYESTYSQFVLNYRRMDTSLDTDLTRYPIKYVIVADPMFTTQLQPFIQWKTKQGYKVIVGYTNDVAVGNTTTSIKAYLQAIFNAGTTGDPAPSFVLFVGDVAQIPAYTGSAGSHSTDLNYARLAGTDILPDVYYGRFSANNTTELQPQIDKTLEYERYQMPDPSYLGTAIMIAGVDASWAPVHANGQINYGTNNYFNAAHGITSLTHLYPASGSADAQIIAQASAGAGYINYTAHGSETSWADPTFSVSDVNGLTNNHKYGTVVGNCCVTSSYNITTCFGESWLRAANKGAVGYIGASNNSLWDEDYWWGVGYRNPVVVNPTYSASAPGAYDGMFHDHGEAFPAWYTAQGACVTAGNLAVSQSGSSNATYYWEIYCLMGDPSLSTYFGVPTANTVSYPATLNLGVGTLVVTANPYSYVGLSKDNVLAAGGITDAAGSLTLTFTPFASPGTADIVITRQNRIPVISTIQVIAASGPYVITTGTVITDPSGNNNGQADFGESVYLTISQQNVGTTMANAVTVTLAESDAYLTLDDATESYGNIAVNQTVSISQGFRVTLAANVPDGRVIPISLTATDNAAHSWTGTVNLTAHAPNVAVGTVVVHDPSGNNNGRLDPGESATLDVSLTNTGSAPVANIAALLGSADAYVTITDNSGALTSLAAGATGTVNFAINVDGATPIGHATPFTVGITATNYTTSGGFSLTVGLVLEDFETNNFSRFPWTQGGNLPWTITNSTPQEGLYCARSGVITHSQTSDLSVTLNVSTAGTVSFWYKVSSESGYDYLRFYIDGAQQGLWAGEVPWTQASYAVATGSHTFLWRYYKDGTENAGSDCAWVDYIVFPAIAPPQYPDIALSAAAFDVTVLPDESTTRTLTVSNLGDANLTFTVAATTATARRAAAPDEALDIPLGKDEVDARHGYNSLDTQGGPDTFGYRWIDSNEPGGPAYAWVEIAGVGTRLNTVSDDEQFGVTLPWNFPFYGTTYTAARISSNGNIHFSADTLDYGNRAIPSGRLPNAMLAAFSDDLSPQNGAGIYYYNDVANSRFIVQYDSIPHYGTTTVGVYTFEMILYSNGVIDFQYQTLSGAVNNCTVGIENGTGLDGLQVVYNAAYLTSNLAIRFTAIQPWLRISPAGGTVAPAASTLLTVTLDAAGLVANTYTGQLTITSNDPDEATVVVPVTLTVSVGTPDVVTDLVIYSVGDNVTLQWTPTNGASYRIYTSTDAVTFTDTGIVVTEPTYTFVGEAQTYPRRYYRVTTQR